MDKRLIIDGNAVYELDEECMLKKRLDVKTEDKKKQEEFAKASFENKQNRK